jgi:hypothetical protein
LIAILAIFLNLSQPMISPKMKIIHNAKKSPAHSRAGLFLIIIIIIL